MPNRQNKLCASSDMQIGESAVSQAPHKCDSAPNSRFEKVVQPHLCRCWCSCMISFRIGAYNPLFFEIRSIEYKYYAVCMLV
jgi:hypothetical protein